MYRISNIVQVNKVNYCVWHVVFQMDDYPLEFATDFLYLIKENQWVVNSLVTHELTSLMKGSTCLYCGETKIACFVSCTDFKKVKQGVVENECFLDLVSRDLKKDKKNISSSLLVVNNKAKWDELALENQFYGNLTRIVARELE